MLHADFVRVNMDRRITVTVPVVIKGEARGVKLEGGVIDFVHREIELQTLPLEIPDSIEIDVTNLGLNEAVYVRDVAQGAKWLPVSDADMMLMHVIMPRAVEEPAPESGSGRACRGGSGARGHQEGQDREGRRSGTAAAKGKEKDKEKK